MPKPTATEKAICYLRSNWRDGKTVKEIAELFHLDAGNLERAFKKREGMTVKQFVSECEPVLSKMILSISIL